jgi:hypothetical protein
MQHVWCVVYCSVVSSACPLPKGLVRVLPDIRTCLCNDVLGGLGGGVVVERVVGGAIGHVVGGDAVCVCVCVSMCVMMDCVCECRI